MNRTPVMLPPALFSGKTADGACLCNCARGIIIWHRDEGDAVTEGEPLFQIESKKKTVDVPAPVSGCLEEICTESFQPVNPTITLGYIRTK